MKSLHLSQIGLKTNWTQHHSLTANTYQIPPFCGILPLFTALAVSQNNSKMFSIFKLVTPHYDQDTPQFIKASIFPCILRFILSFCLVFLLFADE